MCTNFASRYVFGRVSRLTQGTYETGFEMYISWRATIGKGVWLEKRKSETEIGEELTEFVAHYCTVRGDREGRTMGNLLAMKFHLTLTLSERMVK